MNQMETGFKWLYETFPFLKGRVNTLWQIDPFGASNTTPLLFNKDFKYAVLNRVGDHIKDQLKHSQNLDFFWNTPFSAGSGILTHLTNKHYCTEQKDFLEKTLTFDFIEKLTKIPKDSPNPKRL